MKRNIRSKKVLQDICDKSSRILQLSLKESISRIKMKKKYINN